MIFATLQSSVLVCQLHLDNSTLYYSCLYTPVSCNVWHDNNHYPLNLCLYTCKDMSTMICGLRGITRLPRLHVLGQAWRRPDPSLSPLPLVKFVSPTLFLCRVCIGFWRSGRPSFYPPPGPQAYKLKYTFDYSFLYRNSNNNRLCHNTTRKYSRILVVWIFVELLPFLVQINQCYIARRSVHAHSNLQQQNW